MSTRHRAPALVLALALAVTHTGKAQSAPCAPFQPGERFEYGVRVARAAASGRGAMWIAGPEVVRGVTALVLHFETTAGVGPIKGSDRTASWLDVSRMVSLRFVKHERHILSTHDDSVEVTGNDRSWSATDGVAGESSSDTPLDELSFIYFLRTLPLAADSTYTFTRHYDAERNPQTVRVMGRDTLRTKAGVFATVAVELRVRDPRHYRGDGVIRIYLSDDARRIPVRIESRMPVFGATVLTLESFVLPVSREASLPR